MYRTLIKRHNVKCISEEPFTLLEQPSKWETLETYDSLGNAEYSISELLRALEKGELLGVKVEYIEKHKKPYTLTEKNGNMIIKPYEQ